MARFCARVRKRAELPSVSMPDIYKHPTIRSLAAALANDPTVDSADNLTTLTDCERRFAEVLADIVGTEHVSVDSHFFDDLGADSMLMARFCRGCASGRPARRYRCQTSTSTRRSGVLRRPSPTPEPTPNPRLHLAHPASRPATPAALLEPRRARNGEYVLCRALQLLFFLGYPALTASTSL